MLNYRLYGEHPPPSKERTARDKAGFSRGVNRDPPALIQRDERNREHPKQAGNSSSQVIWEKKGGGTSGVRGLGPILAMPGARGGRREAWGQQEQQQLGCQPRTLPAAASPPLPRPSHSEEQHTLRQSPKPGSGGDL